MIWYDTTWLELKLELNNIYIFNQANTFYILVTCVILLLSLNSFLTCAPPIYSSWHRQIPSITWWFIYNWLLLYVSGLNRCNYSSTAEKEWTREETETGRRGGPAQVSSISFSLLTVLEILSSFHHWPDFHCSIILYSRFFKIFFV